MKVGIVKKQMAYISQPKAKIFHVLKDKSLNGKMEKGHELPVQTKGNTNCLQTCKKMSIIREMKINRVSNFHIADWQKF